MHDTSMRAQVLIKGIRYFYPTHRAKVGQNFIAMEEMMKLLWRATAAALILCLAQPAGAAEIKVLCIPGIKAAFDELMPQFERIAGHKVVIRYEIYAGQKKEIESGDFDVAIFANSQIEEMNKQGRIAAGSNADIARTSIGVAVRKGAPKPNIEGEEAFKSTLLAAKSITYTKESSTGVYITRLLERLGIADTIKDKLKLQPGGSMTTPAVARGDAELGIVLISDILATPGVDLVGPLPEALQNHVMQTAALAATAKQPAAGAALIKFLSSTAAGPVFKSKGLEPPPR
jgi:molybdate transport system substrate-binding protein